MTQQRHDYLRSLRKNRNDKRPVVFLDETWLSIHTGSHYDFSKVEVNVDSREPTVTIKYLTCARV